MAKKTKKNPRYKGNGKKTARHYSAGGYLVGPSHEQGGIPAIVDGTEPIEVEGGEFVINKQTVNAVGEDFLHKLNSTQTSHHTGGFSEGQLPSPSQYADGGKITRRNKMARGRRAPQRRRGTAPARRMARGGNTPSGDNVDWQRRHKRRKRPTAEERPRQRGRQMGGKMAAGGRACGGPGQMPCGGRFKRGGRTKPVARRMGHGGNTHRAHSGHGSVNKQCRMFSGDAISCRNHPNCSWDPSTDMCN